MKTKETAASLENYLLQHIPISAAIGIKVESASSQQIILSAPFLNNINHKNTVFGGSLHAVATLACWSLLHMNLLDLSERNTQIVIASSEIFYTAPVISDFKAECCMSDSLEWERFRKTLHRKGKARLKLNAKIFQDSQLCVNFSGQFVAIQVKEDRKGGY